ncbi:MAG TPA: branched-chain amino acid aminotransferase [Desulfobulbaceae bacterium]|nr:branched-chain amino acid aminotransferase [Desulfobulbaceae bacterium]
MLKTELEISVRKAAPEQLKKKPDQNALGFGQYFTDHMFVMRWSREQGWHDAQLQPYQNFSIDPAAMVFHYGQAIFEGLKAYRGKSGNILLFRPTNNFERMNQSAVRMCMPRIPVDRILQALKALVYLDRDWVPNTDGATLYLRPTMIASEPALGLRPANEYLFFILASPVGAYYAEGFNPVKIYVEDKYVRAVPGGVGEAKTAGNYAASVKALTEAQSNGYSQVLWLDALEHKYIEEVGTSNAFFVINDELITPPLAGTILPGITRDSVLQLARDWGMHVNERRISIDEVVEAAGDGSLQEVFSTGTAAVISPLGELCYKGECIPVNGGKTGMIAQRLFDELQAIQFGMRQDAHRWMVRVA